MPAASGIFTWSPTATVFSGAQSDLRLEGRLLHLQLVCRLEPSELQLALRVTLIEAAGGRVIASRNLSIEEPVTERTPYGGVQAANRAVARLLTALQGFLAEQLDDTGRR